MTANASGTMQAGQFTPGQLTPKQFTPGQFTPGQFTPGRLTPGYTLPFTIDIAIKTRGELSLGRTIYPGYSDVGTSPRLYGGRLFVGTLSNYDSTLKMQTTAGLENLRLYGGVLVKTHIL